MTSEGTQYPRPLLTSARPARELHDCTVLPLNVPEFSTISNIAAAARKQLAAARVKDPAAGCFILRTESLFRGFYSNRRAGCVVLSSAGRVFCGTAWQAAQFSPRSFVSRAMQHGQPASHGRPGCLLCASPWLSWRAGWLSASAPGSMPCTCTLSLTWGSTHRCGALTSWLSLVAVGLLVAVQQPHPVRPQELLPVMVGHMRELGYDASTPLYAASGLLTYNDTSSERSKHP